MLAAYTAKLRVLIIQSIPQRCQNWLAIDITIIYTDVIKLLYMILLLHRLIRRGILNVGLEQYGGRTVSALYAAY